MGRNSGGGGKGQAVIPTQKPKNPQSEEYRAYAYKIMAPAAGLRVAAVPTTNRKLLEKGYRYVITPDKSSVRGNYQIPAARPHEASRMYARNTGEVANLIHGELQQRIGQVQGEIDRGMVTGWKPNPSDFGSGFSSNEQALQRASVELYNLQGHDNYWRGQAEAYSQRP
jgi:hypothetical protein